ncbi:hypothetical protein ASG29_08955 [Sphingomonas sp. Leaf412]|nr:hypothetical protein ASG29_08955 [Sphingomonas sp. Leaf412]
MNAASAFRAAGTRATQSFNAAIMAGDPIAGRRAPASQRNRTSVGGERPTDAAGLPPCAWTVSKAMAAIVKPSMSILPCGS